MHGQAGHGDEIPIVRPDLGRAMLQRDDSDLKVEDVRPVDLQLSGRGQQPIGEPGTGQA